MKKIFNHELKQSDIDFMMGFFSITEVEGRKWMTCDMAFLCEESSLTVGVYKLKNRIPSEIYQSNIETDE